MESVLIVDRGIPTSPPVALRAKNKLTARKLLAGGFSKDGAQVYGIVRNTTPSLRSGY
jgi:hypothetical protein